MEEKRKELMQLIISMTDEEHLDSLLEVARFVSSVEGNIHNRLDMEDYLMVRFWNARTRKFRESSASLRTAVKRAIKSKKKRGRHVCVVPFGYLVCCSLCDWSIAARQRLVHSSASRFA